MSENNFAKKHQMKLRARKNNEVLSKKLIESSESDDSSWEENEEQEESSEYEPEINLKEYRTLLSKIFPSKYITEKAKNTPQNTNIKINKKVNKKEKLLDKEFLLLYSDNYSSLNIHDLISNYKRCKFKSIISICKKKIS